MNVRVIDPVRIPTGPRRPWQAVAPVDDFADLDRGPSGPEADDRLNLWLDLLDLAAVQLAGDAGGFAECFAARAAEVRSTLAALRRVAEDRGLAVPPSPRVDVAAGLEALAQEAGVAPLARVPEAHGVLFVQALLGAVAVEFFEESDAAGWRRVLIPSFAEGLRFEGALRAMLAVGGDPDPTLGKTLEALASRITAGKGGRVWSFDLLRMSIRRSLAAGDPRGGGFFPGGMRGFSRV